MPLLNKQRNSRRTDALQDIFGTREISADDETGIGLCRTGYRLQNRKAEVSPAVLDTAQALPSADEISGRAYAIYLARGGVGGDGLEDWFQAERELKEQYCDVKVHFRLTVRESSSVAGCAGVANCSVRRILLTSPNFDK